MEKPNEKVEIKKIEKKLVVKKVNNNENKVDKVEKKQKGNKVNKIEKVEKVDNLDGKNVEKVEKGAKVEKSTEAKKKDEGEKRKEGDLSAEKQIKTPDAKIQPITTPESSKIEGKPDGKKFVNPNLKLTLRRSPWAEESKKAISGVDHEMQLSTVLVVNPINVAYPEKMKKEKRETQLCTVMVSPYVARPVSLKKGMAAIEKRISESIFSAWKPPT